MTRIGAVATAGTIPAIGQKNIANRKRPPTTTDVRPVRPPWDTPDALSM